MSLAVGKDNIDGFRELLVQYTAGNYRESCERQPLQSPFLLVLIPS